MSYYEVTGNHPIDDLIVELERIKREYKVVSLATSKHGATEMVKNPINGHIDEEIPMVSYALNVSITYNDKE